MLAAMTTSPLRSSRALRRAGWAAAGLLALYLLYLLAANLFLHSDWARSLVNRQPARFEMAWEGGQTWWPGRVSLREVRMRGQARRTRWSVDAASASGRIALWPLLRREIRIPWVAASGVTGMVDRVAEHDAIAATEAASPQAASASVPASGLPHAPQQVPAAPAPRGGGWTLRMDRIASDSVLAGDVFGWRVEGQGMARTGFRKELRGGPLELFDSEGHFRQARLGRDGDWWLEAAEIDTRFSLPWHRPQEHPGKARLALLAAELQIDGRTRALRARRDGEDRYHFDSVPGEGTVALDLALADGMLARGGRAQVRLPLHALDPDGVDHENVLTLQLEVDEGLRLRTHVPARDAHDIALYADLMLPGRALPLDDWRRRLATASGSASGRWHVPSIAALVALFVQADWLDIDGSGTVEGELRLAQGRLADGSHLRIRDVDARAEVLGNRFQGRADADAVIAPGEAGAPATSRVQLALQRFSVAPAGSPGRPYVSGNDLRLDLVSEATLERMRETLQARLRFEGASVPELAVFNRYLPNERLRFAGGAGRLSGDLRVDGAGEVGEGRLRVDASRARMAVAGLGLGGNVVIDGRLRRGNLQQGHFDLGGSRVRLRDVGFREPGGVARSGWWADLEMPQGRVAWQAPAEAGGRLRARMKNVDFLLAMFASRADYPAWIGRVVDAGEATVEGRWQWQGDALVLDRMHAANDRFQLDARLRLQGERRQGDLHAKWGVLGVGVELQGEQRKLHLRGAREWYDGRPDLLR